MVEDNRIVDYAGLVDLVQLLDRVLLFQVEAEDAVHEFAHGGDAADEQDFLGRNLHRLKAAERTGDSELH